MVLEKAFFTTLMAVQFDEPTVPLSMKLPAERAGSLTRFFISIGLAKTTRDAQIVMVTIAVLMFAGAAYLFFTSAIAPKSAPLTPEQQRQVLDEGVIRH